MGTEQPLFMASPLERLLGGEVGGRGRERKRERQHIYLGKCAFVSVFQVHISQLGQSN